LKDSIDFTSFMCLLFLSTNIRNEITKLELICVGVVRDTKNILKSLKLANRINTGAGYVTHHISGSGL
jgi:hypothetical protein